MVKMTLRNWDPLIHVKCQDLLTCLKGLPQNDLGHEEVPGSGLYRCQVPPGRCWKGRSQLPGAVRFFHPSILKTYMEQHNKTALPLCTFLIFPTEKWYKQLQVVIYGEEQYDKGGFEEQEPKVMCSMTHRSTLYLLCDFTEVRQSL